MPILNSVLTLQDLPPPPPDKTGWPWTEQPHPLPTRTLDSSEWLRISIVTPSYNQGEFIEETIRSVLLQGYPNLEYIIIDGGSTDNTLEILQKYQNYIAYWVSEPDEGQADAINKGFCKATGDLIGWQNSDDYYYPQAFIYAAQGAMRFQDCEVFYGSRDFLNLEGEGILTRDHHMSPFNLEKMIPNANMSNQSAFFRKIIFEDGNFLDKSFHHCMDHEFFWRLIFKGYKFTFTPEIKGCYRLHRDCKGRQLANTWLQDTVRICKRIYKNSELPLNVRKQAWLFLRGTCLDNYGNLRLNHFRQSVHELIAFRGLTALDSELVVKYLVSLVGAKGLRLLRKFKVDKNNLNGTNLTYR